MPEASAPPQPKAAPPQAEASRAAVSEASAPATPSVTLTPPPKAPPPHLEASRATVPEASAPATPPVTLMPPPVAPMQQPVALEPVAPTQQPVALEPVAPMQQPVALEPVAPMLQPVALEQQPVALADWPCISNDDFPECQNTSNVVELFGPSDANVDVNPDEVAPEYREEAELYREELRKIRRFSNPKS